MTLAEYTEPGLLVPCLLSEYRDSAIAELGGRLETAQRIENAREFTHAVLDHESFVSAVFGEAAFPLARGPVVKELSFAVGLAPQGIRWGLGNAPTVHAVILVAVPLSVGKPYLSLVVTFSKFLHDKTAFSALRRCAQAEEMFDTLMQVRVR